MKVFFVFIALLLTLACQAQHQDLRTVSEVDIQRYVGKWYAIAALPQFFTRKCLGQTAEYAIMNPQTVSVLNTCLKGKGKMTTIEGQAVVVNAVTNAELEVTFNNFFTRLFRVKGDYNIIKLDSDYRFVLVASRNRKSMWIMARSPNMPTAEYEAYVAEAKAQGFDVRKIIRSRF